MRESRECGGWGVGWTLHVDPYVCGPWGGRTTWMAERKAPHAYTSRGFSALGDRHESFGAKLDREYTTVAVVGRKRQKPGRGSCKSRAHAFSDF